VGLASQETAPKKIPVRDDFFTSPLEPLEQVRLKGTKCRTCGEVFLGKNIACLNCQSSEMEEVILSRQGKLYGYTIIRNRPPGDYKGQDNPFVPFATGLVELPEGLIILSRLTQCDLDSLNSGMDMKLTIEKLYEDEQGNEVLTYAFKPL